MEVINSTHSFIRFSADAVDSCQDPKVDYCLPVFSQADINFQFIVQGTAAEITALSQPGVAEITMALVTTCGGAPLISFAQKPQRFKISETQLLYTWEHGFPGFPGTVKNSQCFLLQITVGGVNYCSNCFERIIDPCFTSVLEFGNDEDAFGYKYCHGLGASDAEAGNIDCTPTIINFLNQSTLAVPYTAEMKTKYGNVPTIQTWIYDAAGVLTNMNIQATFDAYPPNILNFDFGGPASGIIVIR